MRLLLSKKQKLSYIIRIICKYITKKIQISNLHSISFLVIIKSLMYSLLYNNFSLSFIQLTLKEYTKSINFVVVLI